MSSFDRIEGREMWQVAVRAGHVARQPRESIDSHQIARATAGSGTIRPGLLSIVGRLVAGSCLIDNSLQTACSFVTDSRIGRQVARTKAAINPRSPRPEPD